MSRKQVGTGTSPGHVRDITGTSPGGLREVSGIKTDDVKRGWGEGRELAEMLNDAKWGAGNHKKAKEQGDGKC